MVHKVLEMVALKRYDIIMTLPIIKCTYMHDNIAMPVHSHGINIDVSRLKSDNTLNTCNSATRRERERDA